MMMMNRSLVVVVLVAASVLSVAHGASFSRQSIGRTLRSRQAVLNAEPPATTTATTEEPGTVLDVYRLHEGTKDALRYLKNTNFATLPGVWRFIDEYAQGDRQLKFTDERDLIHFKIRVATPVEGKYVQYDGGKPDKDKKFTKQALALAEKVVGQKTVRMPSLKDRRYLSSTDQECIWYSMPKAVECPPESPIGTVVDGNPCQWKIVAEVGRWDFMRVLTNMMPSKWKKVMSPLMRTSPLPAGYWRKVPMGLADRLKGSKSMVEYFESAVEETERKQTLWGTRR